MCWRKLAGSFWETLTAQNREKLHFCWLSQLSQTGRLPARLERRRGAARDGLVMKFASEKEWEDDIVAVFRLERAPLVLEAVRFWQGVFVRGRGHAETGGNASVKAHSPFHHSSFHSCSAVWPSAWLFNNKVTDI